MKLANAYAKCSYTRSAALSYFRSVHLRIPVECYTRGSRFYRIWNRVIRMRGGASVSS